VRASRELADEIIAAAKTWRRANGGKKAEKIALFGAFRGKEEWVPKLKDALGYNTDLPDGYPRLKRDLVATHFGSIPAVRKLAETHKQKDRLAVVSFGDEIGLGRINFKDPKNQTKFRDWLKARGVTAAELGMEPASATLTGDGGDPRLVWFSNLFNEEERFADFRATTEEVKKLFGPEVLAGANYSPHHLALCYGPVFQWVDIFKHNGMSMFWAEDYVFSVPELPQAASWMLAQARCGVKYHKQPIHFYIMPHAPGQTSGFLRRNSLLAVGSGATHLDSFWVAPPENFTENYVAWGYREQFRTLAEANFDTAEAERFAVGGTVRPARVAVVIGKATDFNESRLMVAKGDDPFVRRCKNGPEKVNRILCRKEQQMLYIALKHAGHAVDLITEDDIAERDELKGYDAVYFAGEWIDTRALPKLDAWVKAGGTLYAAAGLGRKNQYDQPETGLLSLLGLTAATADTNLAVMRTLLELPVAEPIDTLTLGGEKVAAVGMRQRLTPAAGTEVLATWSDGTPAATVRSYGKGRAFAVGTLPGTSYMKTGLRVEPFSRGGNKLAFNPTKFARAATKLTRLGIDSAKPAVAVTTSEPLVEALVIDHPRGSLVTLVNWTNAPLKDLSVSVRLPAAPSAVRSVSGQKELKGEYKDGAVTFRLDLAEADYVLLPR
jgi:hypothetical protein